MIGSDVDVYRAAFGTIWNLLANPRYVCELMCYSEGFRHGNVSIVKLVYTIQSSTYLDYCSREDDPSHVAISTSYRLRCQVPVG